MGALVGSSKRHGWLGLLLAAWVVATGLDNLIAVMKIAQNGSLSPAIGSPVTSDNTDFSTGVCFNTLGTLLFVANANWAYTSVSVYKFLAR